MQEGDEGEEEDREERAGFHGGPPGSEGRITGCAGLVGGLSFSFLLISY